MGTREELRVERFKKHRIGREHADILAENGATAKSRARLV